MVSENPESLSIFSAEDIILSQLFAPSESLNKYMVIKEKHVNSYSKRAALVSPWRAIELIGIRTVITDERKNKSHMSITFIQHSLKRHSPFRPAGSFQDAAIVTLSDGCTLRIQYFNETNLSKGYPFWRGWWHLGNTASV